MKHNSKPYTGYTLRYNGSTKAVFVFYRISFINPFKRKMIIYVLPYDEGKEIVSRQLHNIGKRDCRKDWFKEVTNTNKPTQSYTFNIERIEYNLF